MIDYMSLALYGVPLAYISTKIISYLVWYFRTLNESVRFAAASPIPYVTIYSTRASTIFWLMSPYFAPFFEALPFGWGQWIRYVRMDFDWWYQCPARRELGSDVYWVASPGGLCLMVTDADVISEIAHRWKDFGKMVEPYRTLAVFGQNVVTSEGTTWQRHRKITGPPFNEKNSSLVFADSIAQAKAMLASFTSDADGKRSSPGNEPVVDDLLHWTMTVTLHVLSGAAFSLKMPWPTKSIAASSEDQFNEPHSTFKITEKHTMSFQQSVDSLMDYLPFIIFFPSWLLRNSPLSVMRKMQHCADEFRTYMSELIGDNQDAENASRGDLLGSIVRAGSAEKTTWTEEETIGNIFVFILAGHETTASTLQSAIIMLACHPEYQQQVQDELDSIWSDKKPGEDWVYEDYPKMRCVMALMFETLRRYAPVNLLPKHAREAQSFTYRGQTVHVPAGTDISLAVVSTQHNPLYWGEDVWDFRPSRWLMPPGYFPPPNSSNESPPHENLYCPPKGAFLAFSAGFRACLGKKFAQVEFSTLVAVLFKEYSVELVKESKDETWEEARDKAMAKMHDRTTGIASRMKSKVKVRFVKRGSEKFPPRS
ncbi:cytochrome P450 [Mollisia scopiformis]|uniref:Cytochrome P450 n=1 Tax=Mollisia scopiformis TaxID=149040 RepID=A0A194XD57_MOLSC|nr:cytochrome P450 [Mollisia scopiformis]KUJ18110.1 cytochrome P450 [Mollisia scopiformis]